MPVYFIQAGDSGPIKIGVAKSVERRLHSLQCATHERLRLIGTVDGDDRLERALHKQLWQWRIIGEWFAPVDAVLAAMAAPPKTARRSADHPSLKTIFQLATELGFSAASQQKYRRRGVPHRHRLPILRLAEQRGITIPDEAFDAPPSAPSRAPAASSPDRGDSGAPGALLTTDAPESGGAA